MKRIYFDKNPLLVKNTENMIEKAETLGLLDNSLFICKKEKKDGY